MSAVDIDPKQKAQQVATKICVTTQLQYAFPRVASIIEAEYGAIHKTYVDTFLRGQKAGETKRMEEIQRLRQAGTQLLDVVRRHVSPSCPDRADVIKNWSLLQPRTRKG